MLTAALTTTVAALPGCGEPIAVRTPAAVDTTLVLSNVATGVILGLYRELDGKAAAFDTAVGQLAGNPTDANLAAAQAAWRTARAPWEQSEGFLFGPVETGGYDPALDTWPFNLVDAQTLLAGSDPITPTVVASLDGAVKGFHAIEYLIFGQDAQKHAADLTPRELEYLVALASDLATSAHQLRMEWEPSGGNFVDQLGQAGVASDVYFTRRAALQELVNGMLGICAEVADGKIAEPFESRNLELEESRFSNNSRTDFVNNLTGAATIYTGSYAGQNYGGLSAVIVGLRPDLDRKLRAQFDSAIAALGRMSPSFGQAVLDNRSSVEHAQRAVHDVAKTLEHEILPLLHRP